MPGKFSVNRQSRRCERWDSFIYFQPGMLLLIKQQLWSVSRMYKHSSKTRHCQTIHKLFMPKSVRKSKTINEEPFVPIFNAITALNIYVIWCSIWHQFGTVLVIWELCLLQLRIPCGILTLPINICSRGCQKIR